MKRQVADRLFLNAVSITFVSVAYFEPRSVAYGLVHTASLWGHACMIALLIGSIFAIADTVWNDVMPEHRVFQFGLGKRRGLWISIGVMYAMISFVAHQSGYGLSSVIYWLLVSARCTAVAFLDLYYEYEDTVKDPATPINGTIPGALGDV